LCLWYHTNLAIIHQFHSRWYFLCNFSWMLFVCICWMPVLNACLYLVWIWCLMLCWSDLFVFILGFVLFCYVDNISFFNILIILFVVIIHFALLLFALQYLIQCASLYLNCSSRCMADSHLNFCVSYLC